MKAVIFTEDSSTTSDSHDTDLLEYYKGSFLSAKPVYVELSDICDPNMYVASNKFGIANVETKARQALYESSQLSHEELIDIINERVLIEAADSEVIVLLFSSIIFESAIMPDWDKIVNQAKEGSVWCICAPQSLLSELDLSKLEQKCQLIIYERVGVSRITNSTRDELIDTIKNTSID